MHLEIVVYGLQHNSKPYIVLQCRDVSHRDTINKLQEQSKRKSNTISFVSHEYRTPISCIIRNLEEYLLSHENNL
jgi:signal transduction histidine kinase